MELWFTLFSHDCFLQCYDMAGRQEWHPACRKPYQIIARNESTIPWQCWAIQRHTVPGMPAWMVQGRQQMLPIQVHRPASCRRFAGNSRLPPSTSVSPHLSRRSVSRRVPASLHTDWPELTWTHITHWSTIDSKHHCHQFLATEKATTVHGGSK